MPSGGSRPHSGRKPGPAWDGSGEYEKGEQLSVTLRPDLKRWLSAQAQECGVSMSALVNLFIWRAKKRSEGVAAAALRDERTERRKR